jgi:hypothetical protein
MFGTISDERTMPHFTSMWYLEKMKKPWIVPGLLDYLSFGASPKEKAVMGGNPHILLDIHPCNKLQGIQAFSHKPSLS